MRNMCGQSDLWPDLSNLAVEPSFNLYVAYLCPASVMTFGGHLVHCLNFACNSKMAGRIANDHIIDTFDLVI